MTTTGDKAELLPCPVCKHPMTYEPYDPNSWISPPEHYECGQCGTIVQSKGIAILQAAGVSGVPEVQITHEQLCKLACDWSYSLEEAWDTASQAFEAVGLTLVAAAAPER